MPETWRPRRLTLEAMVRLCFAKALVTFVRPGRWRASLGLAGEPVGDADGIEKARRLAGRVERGAARLPFEVKCLPQAMALSWMLRQRRLPHDVVIAARSPDAREDGNALHAWVETGKITVLGDLPGAWHELDRLGESPAD